MTQTVDDFRNFFKPTKEATHFCVKDAVAGVFKILEKQLKATSIDFVLEIEDGTTAYGYENEFKQVILNLVTNAKDAIENLPNRDPEHIGKIEIKAKSGDSKTEISITDNGGGIPDDILASVFDAYFSTKGDKGTGIGLYVSKTIIEDRAGGRLSCENTGNGTRFLIEMES